MAALRATNGGEVRRLQYELSNIDSQISNNQAANGRIMDVDIAAESSNLAKQQVLVQGSRLDDCPGKCFERCGSDAPAINLRSK